MELFKFINEEEIKNNEKQLKTKKKLSNISQNNKHLKIKLSEFDKVPTPSNRVNCNKKNNSKQSKNNVCTNSKFGLKKNKTLNTNQDKIISNNANKNNFSSKSNKFNYSIDKIYTNENRENLNSIKKYKIVINKIDDKKNDTPYSKEITENNNNKKITNSKIMNNDLKCNKIKNTFLGKPLSLNNLLVINSNEIRNSRRTSHNLKEFTIKKDSNKNQDLHIKVSNNNTSNKKNINKNFSTKNIEIKKGDDGKLIFGRKCFISNQNIVKVDLSKKGFNDCIDGNCDQRKINKKKKKLYHFDFDKELKLKRPIKHNIFQSLISINKENIFSSDKKLIKIDKKKVKKKVSKKKDDSLDSLIHNIFDSSSFSKSNRKEKDSCHSSILKNHKLKIQQYKMNHINSISLGRYLKKSSDKNNHIIKVPAFSVVKPEKLISFEFNREYETRNRSYYMNKYDNVNDETNNKEKRDFSQKNERNHKIKKKKFNFCCL